MRGVCCSWRIDKAHTVETHTRKVNQRYIPEEEEGTGAAASVPKSKPRLFFSWLEMSAALWTISALRAFGVTPAVLSCWHMQAPVVLFCGVRVRVRKQAM